MSEKKEDKNESPNTMFFGTLLLFGAGMASSYNLPASVTAFILLSTTMHAVTLRLERKHRLSEHLTAWLLGAMAGILVFGTLLLPYFDIYPKSDFILILKKQ